MFDMLLGSAQAVWDGPRKGLHFLCRPARGLALVASLLRPRAAELGESLVESQSRVGVVGVNRFEVLYFDLVFQDSGILIHPSRDLSNHVFDKSRVLVRLFGDKLLIRPLENRVERAARRRFHHFDQVFDPYMITG